ncbi:MAG: helix-turn-helix domain-containing protein [Polyangiaceae bacterium]
MARTPNTTPRRRPTTALGDAIGRAILDAAEALLAEGGVERSTTNAIAARAGVSIGSLYQYYPSREAILAEVARRMEVRTARLVLEALERTADEPLEAAASAVVDVLLRGHFGSVPARVALRRALPPEWARPTSAEVDAEVRGAVAARLASRADVRGGSPVIVFVVVHAVESVVESAVLDAPELLASEEFRAELVRLVVRYLDRRSDG